ncbi:hypothetical protein BS78_02G097500 [Paspalum vaginatum]|nr:hypothetical protein BS78_02G097500 [Paspalum vaginatum]KAJ1288551.1 hypothetical protein BS78_02G097500 [Paspalum vaginatum]
MSLNFQYTSRKSWPMDCSSSGCKDLDLNEYRSSLYFDEELKSRLKTSPMCRSYYRRKCIKHMLCYELSHAW